MNSTDNVIQLATHNLQVPDQKPRDVDGERYHDILVEAIWESLENSKYAKDPNNPDAPSLVSYMTHLADVSPREFMNLMSLYCFDKPQP
jgi:hypothetical protein